MRLPFRARKLNTQEGFIDEWRKLLKEGLPGPYAYDTLEKEYFDFYGYYRYSDYKSFYHTFYTKVKNNADSPT
jgi:hypothetical protein